MASASGYKRGRHNPAQIDVRHHQGCTGREKYARRRASAGTGGAGCDEIGGFHTVFSEKQKISLA